MLENSKKGLAIFTFLILSFITLNGFLPKKKMSVEGAWTFAEVKTVKADGTYTSTFPTEGLALFSKNHYSITWTSHQNSIRKWQITDSIKLARFNQSIINSGSFELKDSILTTKATFAMNPMFTEGLAKFKCSFIGDTLVLRGLSVNSSDNVAHPVYANGSYIVNKLVRVRKK